VISGVELLPQKGDTVVALNGQQPLSNSIVHFYSLNSLAWKKSGSDFKVRALAASRVLVYSNVVAMERHDNFFNESLKFAS
jgi:hypothetical protein